MKLIQTINLTAQTIAVGEPINLGNIDRKVCCKESNGITTFNFTNGSTSLTLNQCGYYTITPTIVASGNATGVATIQLFANGVAVPGAISSTTITAANDVATFVFSKNIRVFSNSPLIFTLVVSGVELAISSLNLLVTKDN